MASTSRATAWIVGTVLLSLLIVLGGWLLLIGPTLTAAAQTRDDATAVEDANIVLQARIVTLKKQYAEIDTYRADLAALRTQIPSTADTANLLRGIQNAAGATGVALVSITPGTAAAATTAAASSEVMSGAGVTDSTEASDSTSTDSASSDSDSAATATNGLVAIPLSVDLVGSYTGVLDFLTAAQNETGRLYYVTGMSVTSLTDSEAGGGRPATSVGDAEMQLNGYIFVLPESAVAASDPTATAAPLPGAVAGKNPLVPVAG